MERKQGFFSALKEEVVRGLPPARSRSKSPARSPVAGLLLPRWRKARHQSLVASSGRLRPGGEAFAPLMKGPDTDAAGGCGGEGVARREAGWGQWIKGQLSRAPSVSGGGDAPRRSDLRLLLGVMGAPLTPIHVASADPLPHLSIENTPIETSSAQYILQQYTAASGGLDPLIHWPHPASLLATPSPPQPPSASVSGTSMSGASASPPGHSLPDIATSDGPSSGEGGEAQPLATGSSPDSSNVTSPETDP